MKVIMYGERPPFCSCLKEVKLHELDYAEYTQQWARLNGQYFDQEGISGISLLVQASHIWRTYPRRWYQIQYPPTLILSWIGCPICVVSVLLQAFNVQMKIFSSTCVDLALCRLTQIISLKTLFITATPWQTTSPREDVFNPRLHHPSSFFHHPS